VSLEAETLYEAAVHGVCQLSADPWLEKIVVAAFAVTVPPTVNASTPVATIAAPRAVYCDSTAVRDRSAASC